MGKLIKVLQKLLKCFILLILVSSSNYLFAGLNWMPSNYWFTGYMYINGDPNLSYNIVYWSDKAQKMELSPISFNTNTVIDIATLSGGTDFCIKNNLEQTSQGCINMGWNGTIGTAFLLVPNLPFTDFQHPENEQAFQNDLRAGKFAPYIFINRQANIINIYIIGPTMISKYAAQKLSFNFLAFEQQWVAKSWWYNHLDDHAKGMAFAFSFDANTGTFLYTPEKKLNDGAFYIYGIAYPGPLGWSWTHQGPENKDVKGMTAATLQAQGILEHQGPFIGLDDLQGVINFINWSGYGNFENVK